MSEVGDNAKTYAARWRYAFWTHPNRDPFLIAFCSLIYRYMDRHGSVVAISNAQISNECGMSLTKAKETKKAAVDLGLIAVVERGNPKTLTKSKIRATIPESRSPHDLGRDKTQDATRSRSGSPHDPDLGRHTTPYNESDNETITRGKAKTCKNTLKTTSAKSSPQSAAHAPFRFDEWWKAYPTPRSPSGASRKTDQPQCRKLYERITSGKDPELSATEDELIKAAEIYTAQDNDPQFIPAPLKWLKGGRWVVFEDEIQPWWLKLTEPLSAERGEALLKKTPVNGQWPSDELGPAPGEPGCVWEHVLDKLPKKLLGGFAR